MSIEGKARKGMKVTIAPESRTVSTVVYVSPDGTGVHVEPTINGYHGWNVRDLVQVPEPIDNFWRIEELLEFDGSGDDFYHVQLIQRGKDAGKTGNRCVRSYSVQSVDYLRERYDEIRALCDTLGARAMVNLNRRSLQQVAHRSLKHLADLLEGGQFTNVSKIYEKAAGIGCGKYPKRWLLDFDGYEPGQIAEAAQKFGTLIEGCRPVGGKVLSIVPSRSGFHLITNPFDLREFPEASFPPLSGPSVHKDNPTNLYIP